MLSLWFPIDAHSTVFVASIASQMRFHLARSSPLTRFGSVNTSFRRSRSTMTRSRLPPGRTRLQPCRELGTVVKHSLRVVTEAVAVQIYKLLTCQQLDRVNARASGYAAMPAVYTALASLHCNER
eukprot:6199089-Pleurochrysis_carterae.AAC.1